MKADYRDLAIEEAVARIAQLEADLVGRREMLQIALGILHTRQRELEQLQARHAGLIGEFRSFRAAAMRRSAAA